MGMIHFLAARQATGGRVTAVCSRDPKKLAGDWRGIRGNFGPPGEQMDLTGVKRYGRYRGSARRPGRRSHRHLLADATCTPTWRRRR